MPYIFKGIHSLTPRNSTVFDEITHPLGVSVVFWFNFYEHTSVLNPKTDSKVEGAMDTK
jgi:hypothetical protein